MNRLFIAVIFWGQVRPFIPCIYNPIFSLSSLVFTFCLHSLPSVPSRSPPFVVDPGPLDTPVTESQIELHEEDFPSSTPLTLFLCTFPGLQRVVLTNGERAELIVVKARGEVRETSHETHPMRGEIVRESHESARVSQGAPVSPKEQVDAGGKRTDGSGGKGSKLKHWSRRG